MATLVEPGGSRMDARSDALGGNDGERIVEKRNARSSTPTGAPPTICQSARSICSTIRCCVSLLKEEHIKPRLLGHWGTTPGLNFIYAHLNRLIKKLDLDMIYITGPGHGGPGLVANAYLEGTYSEVYPGHLAGRGGYEAALHPVLVSGRNSEPCRARDARLDPRRRRARLRAFARLRRGLRQSGPHRRRVVGDGEAETGPLATSWHSNKFLNPVRDGAVLPILHLNGYKIANPTVLARIRHEELESLMRGYGYAPHFVEGRRSGDDA